MHYQTNFDIAKSELLIEPIRTAISSMDGYKITQLSTVHGFNISFIEIIETTNISDLIKIFDVLTEDNDGLNLVNTYLHEINHEIQSYPHTIDENETDVIINYENLIKNKIKIDLSIINRTQEHLDNLITSIWSYTHKSINCQTEDQKVKDSISKINKKVIELHKYYNVNEKKPSFIVNPDAKILNKYFISNTR